MTIPELSPTAGWSALVSAIATILGLVTLIIFFALGQPWGTINDITSVVLALSLLPVLLALHRLHRHNAPAISLAILILSMVALLVVVAFQTLLISGTITFAQTAVVVPVAFGVFGAALVVYGGFAYVDGLLPRRLALLSIAAGIGYIAVIVGFILGGQEHPLAVIGGLMAVICYPIWAIWFGRMILA